MYQGEWDAATIKAGTLYNEFQMIGKAPHQLETKIKLEGSYVFF